MPVSILYKSTFNRWIFRGWCQLAFHCLFAFLTRSRYLRMILYNLFIFKQIPDSASGSSLDDYKCREVGWLCWCHKEKQQHEKKSGGCKHWTSCSEDLMKDSLIRRILIAWFSQIFGPLYRKRLLVVLFHDVSFMLSALCNLISATKKKEIKKEKIHRQ